jgi:hypothetical protein
MDGTVGISECKMQHNSQIWNVCKVYRCNVYLVVHLITTKGKRLLYVYFIECMYGFSRATFYQKFSTNKWSQWIDSDQTNWLPLPSCAVLSALTLPRNPECPSTQYRSTDWGVRGECHFTGFYVVVPKETVFGILKSCEIYLTVTEDTDVFLWSCDHLDFISTWQYSIYIGLENCSKTSYRATEPSNHVLPTDAGRRPPNRRPGPICITDEPLYDRGSPTVSGPHYCTQSNDPIVGFKVIYWPHNIAVGTKYEIRLVKPISVLLCRRLQLS